MLRETVCLIVAVVENSLGEVKHNEQGRERHMMAGVQPLSGVQEER